MKWNPHIHVLIAKKILNSQDGHSKNVNYFSYDSLSKRFQKVLLDLMKNIIPKKVINKIYNDHQKGFYVYAEPKNFPTLKMALNMFLDIVVDLVKVKIELLNMMEKYYILV